MCRRSCWPLLYAWPLANPILAAASTGQEVTLASRALSDEEKDAESSFMEVLENYRRAIDEKTEYSENRHVLNAELDFPQRKLPSSGSSSNSSSQSSSSSACSSGSSSGSGSKCSHDATLEGSLLGACFLISGGFYLVNIHNDHIRQLTWKTFSVAVSIFCAIVIFFSVNDIFLLIAGQSDAVSHRRLSVALMPAVHGRRLGATACGGVVITVKLVLVILLFTVVEGSLSMIRGKSIQLKAWGLIGAHMVGFSIAEAFGNIQVCPPFNDSAGLTLLVVVIALVVLIGMFVIGWHVRKSVVLWDAVVTGCEARWNHQCEHTEDEFFAFGIGFLFSITLRFAIAGDIPALHAVPKGRSAGESALLLIFCFIFGCIVLALGILNHRMVQEHWEHWQTRIVECIQLTFAMTAGWLMLWWGKWMYWAATDDRGLEGDGDVLSARLAMVFLFTLITVAAIFTLDQLALKFQNLLDGLRALMEAFLLMLGLAWEGVFMSVMEGMTANVERSSGKAIWSAFMSVIVCCVVIPAWVLYILPHSLDHGHGHAGGLCVDHGDELDNCDHDHHDVSGYDREESAKLQHEETVPMAGKNTLLLDEAHEEPSPQLPWKCLADDSNSECAPLKNSEAYNVDAGVASEIITPPSAPFSDAEVVLSSALPRRLAPPSLDADDSAVQAGTLIHKPKKIGFKKKAKSNASPRPMSPSVSPKASDSQDPSDTAATQGLYPLAENGIDVDQLAGERGAGSAGLKKHSRVQKWKKTKTKTLTTSPPSTPDVPPEIIGTRGEEQRCESSDRL